MQKLQLKDITINKIAIPTITFNKDDKNDYIKDGLIFHLDGINKGPNEGKWTDLIGRIVYTTNGNVTFSTDYVDGNFVTDDTTLHKYVPTDCTIEICVKYRDNSTVINFATNKRDGLAFARRTTNDIVIGHTSPLLGRKIYYDINVIGTDHKCISASAVLGYVNNNKAKYIAHGYYSSINNTNNITSGGKLYSIRIYNRHLTEKEVLHNQKVDYNRFLKDVGRSIYYVFIKNSSVNITINNVKEQYPPGVLNKITKIVINNKQDIISLKNMFYSQIHISYIDLSEFNIDNVTDATNCFRDCRALEYLDISTWNFGNVKYIGGAFIIYNSNLTTLKFGYNLKVSIDFSYCPLTHESALSVINGLTEVITPQTITFKNITYSTLTDDDIAIAAIKGWNVVSA